MNKPNQINKTFRKRNIIIPIIIGLGVALYMVYKNFDIDAFKKLEWNSMVAIWLLCALVMIFFRDFAYMIRLNILTENKLSFRSVFQSIMTWEFASSITPSVVGGSAVAIFILFKEKIKLGKSTAIVMVTSLLDELFFIIMVPLLFVLFNKSQLFVGFENDQYSTSAQYIFWTSYFLIVLYTIVISSSIFIFPKTFNKFLLYLSNTKLLLKWKNKIVKFSQDIKTSSIEMKGKNFSFWIKTFLATFVSWTSRFWVVNFILLAALSSYGVDTLKLAEHLLVYSRQLIMWIFMLISPTPGASGVAEIVFNTYLEEFTPKGLASTLGLIWRLITYYLYIIIGVIILPHWVNRVFKKTK